MSTQYERTSGPDETSVEADPGCPMKSPPPDEYLSLDLDQIDDWFQVQYIQDEKLDMSIRFMNQLKELMMDFVAEVADSRERAIALTEFRKAALCMGLAIAFDGR